MTHEDPSEQLAGRPVYNADWHVSPGVPGAVRHREDGIDLAQLWGMVRDNLRTVLVIGAVVFVSVMMHCLSARMTFRSVARMYLGELEGRTQSSNGNLEITQSSSSEAGSEIELLRSRSMVRRAVLASGLNVSIAPPGWESPRFWRWLLAGRSPDLLDVAAPQLIATATSLADDVIGPRTYSVKFLSTTEYVLTGSALEAVRGTMGQPLKTKDLSLTLVAGRENPKPGAEFDVVVRPVEEAVEDVLTALSVTVPKVGSSESARVLILEFTSSSRRIASAFLEQLMRAYLDARHAWKTEDASAAERFVTEQLRAMQQSLDRTQEKLAEYRADNRVVVLEGEAEALVQQIRKLEEQRTAAAIEEQSFRSFKRALKDRSLPLEAFMVGEANDAVLQRLAGSLAEGRQKLSELDTEYRSFAPEIKRQNGQLDGQREAVRSYVEARLSRAEQNLSTLNKVIGDLEAKLKTVPGAELRLAQIRRESDVYSRMYSYLLERQQQAAITKASTVSKNRILDLPQVPLREDSPKLGLHLASGILGLLFGVAVVILRGLFSGVFRRENDVRIVLGPVQVFARVPTRAAKLRARGQEAWPAPPMFDLMAAHSDMSYTEAFRSLRTNLYRALPGEHGKVILLTSPTRADGKTTCALSLAAMLAADNRRVLVVDADVRKPTHHALLSVPQEPGLRDLILESGTSWRDAIRTMCLSVGWFDSLTAGAGGSAELLSDGYLATFLVNARSHYDFILIDSPSYPLVSDPLVLAPLSDFVLSVLRLGSTPRKLAEEHLSGIFTVARGYAVVVNSVEAPSSFSIPSAPPGLSAAFRRLQQ